jgi:hypothetical protein
MQNSIGRWLSALWDKVSNGPDRLRAIVTYDE